MQVWSKQDVTTELTRIINDMNNEQLVTLFNDWSEDATALVYVGDEDVQNELKDVYENNTCPDCGQDIPPDAKEGEECSNCGHVWWK